MTLATGTRLGPYEILAPLGAGGMGEVFRARDTKLNRDVAIKVLPEAFAHDHERLARFTREAQTLASLNHPGIATIHGIEEVPPANGSGPGSRALVMELVEGEDLSAHITRGPIPIAEALPIARQIAEALEAAHEHGIVHRDLKPANIKVTPEGAVKVLDFGLAKAMDPAAGSSPRPDVSHSPTLTHQGTSVGMIIGTAAYMSPEQAKGKTVDRRADIWAFGVVLFEMLTGARAFKGDDVSETLASVLKDTLSMDALPSATPPRLKRLIAPCLDRDLKTRLRDIGEARVKIARIEAGGPDSEQSAPTTAVAAALPLRHRTLTWALGVAAVSPDGRWVAYMSNESGRVEIYVRPFAGPAAAGAAAPPRPGPAANTGGGQWQVSTAGGIHPRWRRDGKELYYLAPNGAMMGAPVTVTGSVLTPGTPVMLFPTRIFGGGVDTQQGRQYDVTRDGRFLINTVVDAASAPITLLMNWHPEAKR